MGAMDRANELAGFENGRARTERMAFDIQISAGWMHSGYPIMSQMPPVRATLDVAIQQREGLWGQFHELGHNHQWESCTTSKTVETTNNLWSLYMNEKVFNKKECHDEAKSWKRDERITEWVANGRPEEAWEVWLALDTYSFLKDIFGYDSYTRLFKKYYNMPRIIYEDDRLDTWARLYSQEVGTNLCDYFEWFRFPLSDETWNVCRGLAPFTQNPLVKYQM